MKILNKYILEKFLKTFVFVVIIMIMVVVVIDFTEKNVNEFLLSARFLFKNLDRVQFYDLQSNLLADTDTLDLVPNISVKNQDVQETSIGTFDQNTNLTNKLYYNT